MLRAPSIGWFGIVSLALELGNCRLAKAQSSGQSTSSGRANHILEVAANIGPAWPRFWSSEATNEHVGTTATAALLVYAGYGLSVGIAAEWVRIPWTSRIGGPAHFDSFVIGQKPRLLRFQSE